MSKLVTIIIVNWNTRDMLVGCLRSIEHYEDRRNFRIIVVDNASKDGSREAVSRLFPWVMVLNSGKNIGFAAANNIAMRYTDTPFVLYLNPDTLFIGAILSKMTDFMDNHPNVGALGSKMKYLGGETQPLGLQWFPSPITEFFSLTLLSSQTTVPLSRLLPYKDPEQSGSLSKLYGGCLLVRKQVLDEVGYFDEQFFMYGEDVDLSRRITDAGWSLYYMCEIEIVHLCGGASSRAESQFSTLMKCESISKLMGKYYGKNGKISYRLAIMIGSFARLLALIATKTVFGRLTGTENKYLAGAQRKYIAMAKWALGLQKPVIME